MNLEKNKIIKLLIISYLDSTDNWDPKDVLNSLSYMLLGITQLDIKETHKLIRCAFDRTVDDIIVENFYPDGSHPSLETAIERCFGPEAETFIDNILTNLNKPIETHPQVNSIHNKCIEPHLQTDAILAELKWAKELASAGKLKLAGVIAGSILEWHLSSLCESKGLVVDKPKSTASDYNTILKKNGLYDKPVWRNIQVLIDIRNICIHPRDRQPTPEEVKDLIEGVSKTINMEY